MVAGNTLLRTLRYHSLCYEGIVEGGGIDICSHQTALTLRIAVPCLLTKA